MRTELIESSDQRTCLLCRTHCSFPAAMRQELYSTMEVIARSREHIVGSLGGAFVFVLASRIKTAIRLWKFVFVANAWSGIYYT
jgi:hypothetical protein